MANLGDMVVRIVGDTTGLNKSLTDSQKRMAAFGINAAAVVAAVTAIAKAAAKAVKDVADYGSAIDDASQKTGLSTTAIQEWKYVAEQVGATLSDVTGAVGMMTRGLDTNKETFKKLGIELKNADGTFKSTTEIFNDTVLTLANMEDKTQRDQMAFKLLGRSAQSLIPILNQGTSGIKALTDEANNLGIVLSEDAIKNSDALGDSLLALKSSARGLGQSIVADVTPALNQLVRGFTDFITQVLNARQQIAALESAQKSQPKTLTEVQLALAGVNARLEEERAIRKRRADEGFDTIVQDNEIASLVKLQTELKSLQKEYTLIEQNKKTVAAATTTVVQKTEEEIDAYKKLIDDRTKLISESYAGLEQAAQSQFDFEKGIIDAINRGRESAHQEELRRIDEEKQQRKEAFQFAYSALDSIIDGVYANEIARIEQSELSEEEKARKIAQIKRKQAQWDKAQAVADIAMNTASAIVKALPNVVLAAIVAAMGAAQAAVALSTPLPEVPAFAEGGIVQPQPGGVQATVAEAGVAEAIIPLDRLDNMLSSMGGGTTHLIVNLDSRPLLDKIFDATRNGTVLISSGAVV